VTQSVPADREPGAAVGGPAVLEDAPPYRIVRPFRVRFEESTVDETMRTAIHLAWVADIAWQHSTLLGFGRDWYTERGLFWLVRAVQLDVFRPIHTYAGRAGQHACARLPAHQRPTRERGPRSLRRAPGPARDRLGHDQRAGHADAHSGRLPQVRRDGSATFEMLKVPLPEAPSDAFESRFGSGAAISIRWITSTTAVYLDYFEEALDAAGQGDCYAQFHAGTRSTSPNAAARDDRLVGWTWPHDDGWAYRLAREDGTEIFRARIERLG